LVVLCISLNANLSEANGIHMKHVEFFEAPEKFENP